jgi:hypothetical protein
MSATKARAKWAKTATIEQLTVVARELERDADGTKNVVIRSSIRQQAEICRRELQRKIRAANADFIMH